MSPPNNQNLLGCPLRLWRHSGPFARLVVVICLLLTVYAYLPTLRADFVAQDQWRAFRYSPLPQSPSQRLAACLEEIPGFYLCTGRPLVWLGECAEHAAVARIHDFAPLRPVALALALFSVLVLGSTLSMLPGGFPSGVAAATALVTAPGYSFMYMQSLTALFVLVSLPLAALAHARLSREMSEDRASGQLGIVWGKASLALFLASCCMYPAWAFCVFPLAFAEFCLWPARPLRLRFLRLVQQLVFFFIAALIYYVLARFLAWATVAAMGFMPAGAPYQLTMDLEPQRLVQRVVETARLLFLNPPLNYDLPVGALFLSLLPPSVLLAWRARLQTGGGIPRTVALGVGTWLLGCILLIGSLSPWLFSHMEPLYTRHTLAASLFFCVGVASVGGVLGATESTKAATLATVWALCGLALPTTLSQHRLSRLETEVSRAEIALVRNAVGRWLDAKGWEKRQGLLVILPDAKRTWEAEAWLRGSARAGENAVLSSSQNPVSIPWMLNAVLREHSGHPVGSDVLLIPCGDNMLCADIVSTCLGHVPLSIVASNAPMARRPVPNSCIIDFRILTLHPGTRTGQGQELEYMQE